MTALYVAAVNTNLIPFDYANSRRHIKHEHRQSITCHNPYSRDVLQISMDCILILIGWRPCYMLLFNIHTRVGRTRIFSNISIFLEYLFYQNYSSFHSHRLVENFSLLFYSAIFPHDFTKLYFSTKLFYILFYSDIINSRPMVELARTSTTKVKLSGSCILSPQWWGSKNGSWFRNVKTHFYQSY